MLVLLVMTPGKTADDSENPKGAEDRNRDRELSEFLFRACHDIRTPVRAVRAHAELLLKSSERPATADFEERLRFIADGARKIDLLADGLASYAIALRIDEGSFQSAAMDVLLRIALAKLGKELRENEAEVTYDSLPRVTGDPDRLSQLFEILLANTLRHRGAAAPRVHISAETHENCWRVAVQDNGPGVEAAHLERIFNPFERLHRKHGGGPGLGLTVARTIVERHGGKIWAESNAGLGTTFLFTIPAIADLS